MRNVKRRNHDMLHMKRKLMMAAAGVLAALMVFPAYGASRKPIKSISLTIKAEIKPDTDFGCLLYTSRCV